MMNTGEKVALKAQKKKKTKENLPNFDPIIMETLKNTHITLLSKPSTKFPKAKFVCKLCPYHMDDIDRAVKHLNDNLHQRNLKKLLTKNLLLYLPKPSKLQLESVNECLAAKLKEPIFISTEEYQRRIDLVMKMNELANEINPGNRLVICGSLLTGLSIVNYSDVNIFFETHSKDNKNTGFLEELNKLSEVFKSKLNLKTEIKLTKVNTGLFCKDKQHVNYHISVSNRMQLHSSELIRIYLKIDSRAEELAKLFRYFGKKAFIDQMKDGFFPSEAFPILVIFYLQQLSIPILPNLHKLAEMKSPDMPEACVTRVSINDTECDYINDIGWIKQLWNPPPNTMSLGELWIGLLRFYVTDFNCATFVVSIRSTEPVLKSERNMVNKRLAIEDPFDLKRNLVFRWNTPDIIDYLTDQLQGCYKYFAIPQLARGPLFDKVSFNEINWSTMKPTSNVTPIFTNDNFTETLDIIEVEFKKLYTEQKSFYDVSKWPVELFVKMCLSKILTTIFNSPVDIRNLITLLELKIRQSHFFAIESYVRFKEYSQKLFIFVLKEFSEHFEANDSWGKLEMGTEIAYNLIKKSSQKFINESLNINHTDDEEYESDDMLESDNNDAIETEETIETEKEFVLEDGEEIDTLETTNDDSVEVDTKKDFPSLIKNEDSWKLPIEFKQIFVAIKGAPISSDKPDEYNETQVISVKKEDLVYNFDKACIYSKKLIMVCSLCNTKGHRKESCEYAVPRFDEMLDVLENVDHAWLVKLKTVLNEKFKSIIPNGDKTKINEKFFEKIAEICKNLYPSARPQLFGSTLNGFITKASDLDICLEFYESDKREDLQTKEITRRLKNIGREIKKMPNIFRVDYILKAKVPIIKFHTRNQIQGDISINNSLGLQNTKMLKLYADISNGVKLLGNLIKYMAKTCEIGDASQGTLSSYAYMLMLIHFLQKRGVLPVLQELYEGDRPTNIIDGWDAWYQSDMSTIYKLWNKRTCQNSQIEYLWLDFFYYYAVEFEIDTEVVCIRQSKPLYKIDKNWQLSYIAIEDPFNLSHNLGGSLSLENCRYILECFAHVLRMHSSSENLQRPDSSHYMLLEPNILRPNISGNARSCFICNKPGHIAKDCTDKSAKRTPTKPSNTVPQSSLPSLAPPLQFKKSNDPSRFYLQSEFVDQNTNAETMLPYHIPLKDFKADLNSFSVVPFSMKFGEKNVIVPMLVGKNDIVEKKLNSHLKNGFNNNICTFPLDIAKPVNEPVRQLDDHMVNSPGSQYRRQTPNHMITQQYPNNAFRSMFPQQQFYQVPIMQQNMPPRTPYEMQNQSIRMMAYNPNNNNPRNQPENNPARYQPYSQPYPNWNPHMMGNHRAVPTPNNVNNHTPRGNRK